MPGLAPSIPGPSASADEGSFGEAQGRLGGTHIVVVDASAGGDAHTTAGLETSATKASRSGDQRYKRMPVWRPAVQKDAGFHAWLGAEGSWTAPSRMQLMVVDASAGGDAHTTAGLETSATKASRSVDQRYKRIPVWRPALLKDPGLETSGTKGSRSGDQRYRGDGDSRFVGWLFRARRRARISSLERLAGHP